MRVAGIRHSHIAHTLLFHPPNHYEYSKQHKEISWVLEENKIIKKEITFDSCLFKIFNEMLIDAGNKRRGGELTNINVNLDVLGNTISVWRNSLDWDVVNSVVNTIGAERVFQNETRDLCPSVSSESTIITLHAKSKSRYKVTRDEYEFIEDACEYEDDWTLVSFVINIDKFGKNPLTNSILSLMRKRVVDLAGCLANSGVKVQLNGACVSFNTFEAYVKLYEGISDIFRIADVNNRWDICASVAEQLDQISFVNTIPTKRGGTHVDYIVGEISRWLGTYARTMDTKDSVIDTPGQLWVFVNSSIDDPTFDSEKDMLKTHREKLGCSLLSSEFFKMVSNTALVNGFRQKRLIDIDFEDAILADTAYAKECTLILTEGRSAKTFASVGLSELDTEMYGVFPLRGKVLNVRKSTNAENNPLIKELAQVLGLDFGMTYQDVKSLRYGHLMIMADADSDGIHITALVINLIEHLWPSLLYVPNFLLQFLTPVIKATNTTHVSQFYSKQEYDAWTATNISEASDCIIDYYKGLASHTSEDVKEYFSRFDDFVRIFTYDGDVDAKALNLAFGANTTDDRKKTIDTLEVSTCDDISKEKQVSISDFIVKQYLYSEAQDRRSVRSVIDGQKTVSRKIIHTFLNNSARERRQAIGVSCLSGDVSDTTRYHHGASSLDNAVVSIASTGLGYNNINLLDPKGLAGQRRKRGYDIVDPRYLGVVVSPLARLIFHDQDDKLLKLLKDTGSDVEPEWFIPVIPMILVNGSDEIGIGARSFVPSYNPMDVIINLRRLLDNEEVVHMIPWYRGLRAAIQVLEEGRKYRSTGTLEIVGEGVVKISQLPPKMSGDNFKVMLFRWKSSGMIKDYLVTAGMKSFFIVLRENMIGQSVEALLKKFSLTHELTTDKMCLLDENGKMHKYESIEEIFMAFYKVRLAYYEKRRNIRMCQLKKKLLVLESRERLITLMQFGQITDATDATLQHKGFPEIDYEEGTGFDYLRLGLKFCDLDPGAPQMYCDKIRAVRHDISVLADAKSMWREDLRYLEAELRLPKYDCF